MRSCPSAKRAVSHGSSQAGSTVLKLSANAVGPPTLQSAAAIELPGVGPVNGCVGCGVTAGCESVFGCATVLVGSGPGRVMNSQPPPPSAMTRSTASAIVIRGMPARAGCGAGTGAGAGAAGAGAGCGAGSNTFMGATGAGTGVTGAGAGVTGTTIGFF